jgi:pimeloyl-ACP methyl ester carboxylesterase
MIREKTFNAAEVKLNYAEGPPSGTPMILIHGGGGRWQGFYPLLPNLFMRWHVFALDLRGHGKSGWVPGKYRPEHYVEDVLQFIDHLPPGPLVLFGHSLGGWIALLTAARRPDSIEALILGDPPLNLERFLQFEGSADRIKMWRGLHSLAAFQGDFPTLTRTIAKMPAGLNDLGEPIKYIDLPGVNAASCRDWAKSLSQTDPEAVKYHAEGRLEEYVRQVDFDQAIPKITCPTLLLQGDPQHGGFLSDQDIEEILPQFRDGIHVKTERFGHGLGMSSWNASQVERAVTNFLESL